MNILEFNEASHEYRYGGVLIPSVSSLCDRILGNPYGDVPEDVLRVAADFGTDVHLAIEYWNRFGLEKDLPPGQEHCFREWQKLSAQIKIFESEKCGHYKGLFAGTLDAKGIYNDRRCLVDYKTSSQLNLERYALQLSLYRLIDGWDDIDALLVAWLPKRGYGKLVEVDSWDRGILLDAVEVVLTECY